jgi:hypothetical protein
MKYFMVLLDYLMIPEVAVENNAGSFQKETFVLW